MLLRRPASLHGDLLRLLLGRLRLRNMHRQHAILALAADGIRVHVVRHREAALEATVEALDAMELLVLVFLCLLALSFDRDNAVVERDLDVLCPDNVSLACRRPSHVPGPGTASLSSVLPR